MSANSAFHAAEMLAPKARALFPGCQVYLFGSQAKGCARPHSDIDVGIIVESLEPYINDGSLADRTCELWLAAVEVDDRISACVRSLDDSTGFADIITNTGVRVA